MTSCVTSRSPVTVISIFFEYVVFAKHAYSPPILSSDVERAAQQLFVFADATPDSPLPSSCSGITASCCRKVHLDKQGVATCHSWVLLKEQPVLLFLAGSTLPSVTCTSRSRKPRLGPRGVRLKGQCAVLDVMLSFSSCTLDELQTHGMPCSSLATKCAICSALLSQVITRNPILAQARALRFQEGLRCCQPMDPAS